MNKDLIELQRNCNATCVVVLDSEYKKLSNGVAIKSSVSDNFLLKQTNKFMDKLDNLSKKTEICYFIISNIDEVSFDLQERFIPLVKDREIEKYNLPKNCIIVLTVKDEKSYAKISPKLYHFCVVA